MSKVQFVKPNSIRVTTDLTQEEIFTAKVLAPKSLSIFEEETETFRVSSGFEGSISQYGITFNADNMVVGTLNTPLDSLESKVFAHNIKAKVDSIEVQVKAELESFNNLTDIEVL